MACFIKCRKSSSLQVQLACLLTAVFACCCTGKPQTTKCLIQSYFRQRQGSGSLGNGNLLRVHLQSHAPFTPTRLSFTGSCNDSANNTGQYSVMHNYNKRADICRKLLRFNSVKRFKKIIP